MRKVISLVFSLTFSCIFGMSMFTSKEEQYIPKSEQVVNKLMGKAAGLLSSKYNMKAIGTDVSMPGGNVQLLGLEFQIVGPLQTEELRKILLYSSRDFLKLINDDMELTRYLVDKPFTIKNTNITLFIVDRSGIPIRDPEIGVASLDEGQIEYEKSIEIYNERIKRTIPETKETYEETYEEALKLLQASEGSSNKTNGS